MFDDFWDFTAGYVEFSPSEKAIISDKLIVRDVPHHFRLIDLGEIASEVYFVRKGCLRFYYITPEGKEVTGFFFTEGMFGGSHESFFSQIPSIQVLETLEDSELIVLTYEVLEELYESVAKMNVFVRKLLTHRFSYAQKIVASFILNQPEERYLALLKRQANLLNRIPHHMLASYLGITPVSLSRIRKRIMEE